MKIIVLVVLAALSLAATPASAYYTRNEDDGSGCVANGTACDVMCNNDDRAGVMYWNGSVWTDGVKWNEDFDTEASAIVAAYGNACI